MPTVHVVERTEHLSAIAHRYGFSDYRIIWDYGENAALRQKRKDPNLLLAGDRVVIPDLSQRIESRVTDQRHKFVKNGLELRLRLHLLDEVGRPVRDLPFELEVPGTPGDGQLLAPDGRVERVIPGNSSAGALSVNPRAKVKTRTAVVSDKNLAQDGQAGTDKSKANDGEDKKSSGSTAAGAGAGVLPTPGCDNELGAVTAAPAAQPEQKPPDADPGVPQLAAGTDPLIPVRPPLSTLTHAIAAWLETALTLEIGALDPIDTESGQMQRLCNLGYDPGPLRAAETDDERMRQRSAVEEFQCDHGLPVDGACGAATQAKLKQVYGC